MWGPSSLARTKCREGRRVLKAVKGRWGGWSGEHGPALLRRQRLWAPGASPQGAGRRWGLGPSPRPAASRTSPHFSPASGPVAPRPSRSLPGTGPCHLAACPVPGVTPGARRAFRWGRVCLLTRLLERDPRGSACSLGPWQGCRRKDTPQPCAEGRGRRALASSQLTLPACERTPSSPSQASGRDAAQPPRARHGFVRGPETEPSSKDPRSGPAEVVCDS